MWHLRGMFIAGNIYGKYKVKGCIFLFMSALMRTLCVHLAAAQLNIHVQCGRPICSEVYANNVKFMYTSRLVSYL